MTLRNLSATFVILTLAAAAQAQVLYDPSLANYPNDQGWYYLAVPPAARSFDSGTTQAVLNTQALRAGAGGYSTHTETGVPQSGFPTLYVGTVLSFNLDIRGEGHNARDDNSDGKMDRAGFSVIALANNGKGVEIGFFTDTVWAYNYTGSLFVHAEEAALDTTAGAGHDYDLVLGSVNYTLYADGSPLLSGPMRDYSGSAILPYTLSNYMFFGDDTSSADSSSALGEISVVVPEPLAGLLGMPALLLIRRRR